ncbi:hypothetical protein [Chitinophaga sp. HK235]|uniref:hypothetical protein n=1 Tax=Chitinophaga sp. HK235 TaxID=2952571 RepID=UPI001BA777DA|nr:hypothetical protein [Chitinophaga sp. HK235]
MKTKAKLIASFKVWLVIYPSITLFLYLSGNTLSALPLYIRTLVMTLVLVPWMVFAGLPFVDTVLRNFISKPDDPSSKLQQNEKQ